MASNAKLVSAICKVCDGTFFAPNYRIKRGLSKFCSPKCRANSPEFKIQLTRMIEVRRDKAKLKHPKWNGNTRLCLDCDKPIWIMGTRCQLCFAKTQRGKKRILVREGQSAYSAVHQWVARHLGKPMKCAKCISMNNEYYDWASISGYYKYDLSDWIRLCRKCHWAFDKEKGRGLSKKNFIIKSQK